MKALSRHILILAFFILLGEAASAQAPEREEAGEVFVGEIVYVLDSSRSDSGVLGKVPSEIILTSDGEGRSRWEESMNGSTRIVITDMQVPTQHTLVSFLGKALAIHTPQEQLNPQEESTALIEGCCTEIAGFSCSTIVDAFGETSYVTFAKQLEYPDLPNTGGMTLGFSQTTSHGKAHYIAAQVNETQPEPMLFTISELYTIIEASELATLFSHTNSSSQQ